MNAVARFLTLPFRHQHAIAESLRLLRTDDCALNDEIFCREIFERAAEGGLLGELRKEIDKRLPPAEHPPITPLGSHLVIKRTPVEQTSRGGIVLPDVGKIKPKEGTVIAVGPGRILKGQRRQQMQLRVGDRVLFASYAGTDLRVAGDELVVIEEHDVLATLVAE